MSVGDETRRQLVSLARQPRKRNAKFSRDRPTDWRPHQVLNPDAALGPPHDMFTDAGAWELIASRLEQGHDVEDVKLRKPAGGTGYVMKIMLEKTRPLLYVKLQLRHGAILGRSFHYSERE